VYSRNAVAKTNSQGLCPRKTAVLEKAGVLGNGTERCFMSVEGENMK